MAPPSGEGGAKKKQKGLFALRSDVDVGALQSRYSSAAPFPHVVLSPLFEDDAMQDAKQEAIKGLRADYKETDLFKVFQVPQDLGQLREDKLPALCSLRDTVYSSSFRRRVEKIAGLPENSLSERVDCSANIYMEGGHLLCHDDCIGTRAVSYVIYLTDPEWTEADGGCFEIFDRDACVDRVLPSWNSMMLFRVVPDKSFHAVQEVYGDKPRLSISGWYHTRRTSDDLPSSSLSQLKQSQRAEPLDANYFLEGRDELTGVIAPEYLQPGAELRERFAKTSALRLEKILCQDLARRIALQIRDEDEKDRDIESDERGLRDGWERVGPVHKRRFLTHSSPPGALGELYAAARTTAFRKWVESVAGISVTNAARRKLRRFRPGLDYTIAYAQDEPPRLDLTFCFVGGDQDLWDSGDVGGFETYLAKDDEDGSPDVYESGEGGEGDEDLLSVQAAHNACSIVLRDSGTLRFVKYLSKRAPSSRFDLELVHEIHPDDLPDSDIGEDEDEDDDDDDGESG